MVIVVVVVVVIVQSSDQRGFSSTPSLGWHTDTPQSYYSPFDTRWSCVPGGGNTCLERSAAITSYCTVTRHLLSTAQDCHVQTIFCSQHVTWLQYVKCPSNNLTLLCATLNPAFWWWWWWTESALAVKRLYPHSKEKWRLVQHCAATSATAELLFSFAGIVGNGTCIVSLSYSVRVCMLSACCAVTTTQRKVDRALHWLSVRQRVTFRIAVLVFQCLTGQAPAYLADDCQHAPTPIDRHSDVRRPTFN